MLHHILVKWHEKPADLSSRLGDIQSLFAGAMTIPGVRGVRIFPNVIDRPNRHDLMIIINMEREALPAWDASDVHHAWKEQYGPLIAHKAVFDCE